MGRVVLTALWVLTGCDRVFGLDPRDAPADAAVGEGPATGVPSLAVPAFYEADAPPGLGAYLFEGTGAVGDAVPIVVRGLDPRDEIRVRIPAELGPGWQLCGAAADPGERDLATPVPSPCVRTAGSLALTIGVPISSTVGKTGVVSPVVVTVVRDDVATELPITIVPLDEITTTPPASDGLYAAIRIVAFTLPKTSPPVTLRSVSGIEIAGPVDVSGVDGQTHTFANDCSNLPAGCAGGAAGPGTSSAGASSGCATPPCSATGAHGGGGVTTCNSGGFCASINAPSAGGGGNAVAGAAGTSTTSIYCSNPAGGPGGAAVAASFLVDPVGGGGGGAGGTIAHLTNLRGGGGGGGGGAIALDALGPIQITGTGAITATGGRGGAGITTTCNSSPVLRTGVGGGGAGGEIRLRGASIASTMDLDLVLDVVGGDSPQTVAGAGNGARGRIRIDGLGADSLNTAVTGTVRGPDFDAPAAIVTTETVKLTARAWSASAGFVDWGVRPAGAPAYVLQSTPAGGGAVTLSVPLELGLSEVCVFATPQASPMVAAIPLALKRCTWVARVEAT